jgi:hypothetical protein
MIWVLAVASAVIAFYIVAWQWDILPREVIATRTVKLADGKVLKARKFYRASRLDTGKSSVPGPNNRGPAWEVELPSGRWIDCDGTDCRTAAERALQ